MKAIQPRTGVVSSKTSMMASFADQLTPSFLLLVDVGFAESNETLVQL